MLRQAQIALSIAGAATLCVGFINITPQVIYGEDNRVDVYLVPQADVREVADSTVAIIAVADLARTSSGTTRILARHFGRERNLCSEEAFYEQLTAANCTGSLVGEDLIATAGHCVNDSNCQDYAYVFGFKMKNAQQTTTEVATSEVYTCKEIIAREYTRGQDYAVVRLDRPVQGHRILNLQQAPVLPGDPIYVVGHPSGLPTKVADGAKVRSQQGSFFQANLDTYGGNSGSPVLNVLTNEVVGVLVRGEVDYIYDSVGKCSKSYRCEDDECRGEDVTNISYIIEALNKVR